jgi:hypothetical protein
LLHAGVALVFAIHEVSIAAVLTVPAATPEKADTDALAYRPTFYVGANCIDTSDRLVTWHSRPLDRQYSLYRSGVRVAHAAGFNAYADMAGGRIGEWLLYEFQLTRRHRLYRSICCCPLNHIHLH